MYVSIFSDPHCFLHRKAGVTPTSLARRNAQVLETIKEVTSGQDPLSICAGDLFDRPNNTEMELLKVYEAVSSCNQILAGNHDLINRADAATSMSVLEELLPETVAIGDIALQPAGSSVFWLVPHQINQDVFDKKLDSVEQMAKDSHIKGWKVLILHCNFNNGFAEESDTSLNLSKERAKQLLNEFDYVLLGHEHVPAEHFDGRLIIIGSLVPTGFHDAQVQHRYLVFDTESKETNAAPFRSVWDSLRYFEGTAKEALASQADADGKYFRIIDDGDGARVAARLFEEGAFAVDLRQSLQEGTEEVELSAGKLEALTEHVRDLLEEQHPHLLGLWLEFAKTLEDTPC